MLAIGELVTDLGEPIKVATCGGAAGKPHLLEFSFPPNYLVQQAGITEQTGPTIGISNSGPNSTLLAKSRNKLMQRVSGTSVRRGCRVQVLGEAWDRMTSDECPHVS